MDAQDQKHILIVEDSKDLQFLLSRLLKKAGYAITQAYNGQEAIELLNRVPILPSFILLDMMMPVLDGAGFRKKQLTTPRLAHIPVVLMTADNNPAACAQQLGIAHYFPKPFVSIEGLLAVISKLS